MLRTHTFLLTTFFCILIQATPCLAEDTTPATGEKQDTLLYVRTVPPGAKVLLDGKELGTSDSVFHVEPGLGTVEVQLDGHKANTKKITIRADKITRLELKLEPQADNNIQALIDKMSDPNEPESSAEQLAQQGWQLWQKRDLQKAIKTFQRALEKDPQNQAALNGLGWASFNSGRWPDAEKAFAELIKLNPTHPAALNGLGQLYLAEKKYDEAEEFLLKAAPNAPASWYGLARLYLLQGKFDQAEKYAQMIVDSGQADATAEKMLQAAKEKRLGDGLRIIIEPNPPKTEPVDEDAQTSSAPAASITLPDASDFSSPPPTSSNNQAESTPADNLLKNPSAESGNAEPDNWAKGAKIPGVNYAWDRHAGFESKASLCIEKSANRFFPIAQWSQTVERQGDAPKLEVSAQIKAQRVTKAILDVVFLDSRDQWISHEWVAFIGSQKDGDPPANHDWKKYSGAVAIPQGTVRIVIGLQDYGPGKVWFDDIQAQYRQ